MLSYCKHSVQSHLQTLNWTEAVFFFALCLFRIFSIRPNWLILDFTCFHKQLEGKQPVVVDAEQSECQSSSRFLCEHKHLADMLMTVKVELWLEALRLFFWLICSTGDESNRHIRASLCERRPLLILSRVGSDKHCSHRLHVGSNSAQANCLLCVPIRVSL